MESEGERNLNHAELEATLPELWKETNTPRFLNVIKPRAEK